MASSLSVPPRIFVSTGDIFVGGNIITSKGRPPTPESSSLHRDRERVVILLILALRLKDRSDRAAHATYIIQGDKGCARSGCEKAIILVIQLKGSTKDLNHVSLLMGDNGRAMIILTCTCSVNR